jgi:hypothetical protein
MVDTLRAASNDRILVLLPQAYVQKVIPNSTKHRAGKHKMTTTTDDDQVLSNNDENTLLSLGKNYSPFFIVAHSKKTAG